MSLGGATGGMFGNAVGGTASAAASDNGLAMSFVGCGGVAVGGAEAGGIVGGLVTACCSGDADDSIAGGAAINGGIAGVTGCGGAASAVELSAGGAFADSIDALTAGPSGAVFVAGASIAGALFCAVSGSNEGLPPIQSFNPETNTMAVPMSTTVARAMSALVDRHQAPVLRYSGTSTARGETLAVGIAGVGIAATATG